MRSEVNPSTNPEQVSQFCVALDHDVFRGRPAKQDDPLTLASKISDSCIIFLLNSLGHFLRGWKAVCLCVERRQAHPPRYQK